METSAIILESDPQAANALKFQIEASSRIQCIIAADFKEIQSLLERNPQIKYIFCVYDVSNNEEQIREQAVAEYVHRHHAFIQMHSIGSIKREQVTICERKVLLFTNGDSDEHTNTSNNKKSRRGGLGFRLKIDEFKKRGMYVV